MSIFFKKLLVHLVIYLQIWKVGQTTWDKNLIATHMQLP
jgi:hypothetical protein